MFGTQYDFLHKAALSTSWSLNLDKELHLCASDLCGLFYRSVVLSQATNQEQTHATQKEVATPPLTHFSSVSQMATQVGCLTHCPYCSGLATVVDLHLFCLRYFYGVQHHRDHRLVSLLLLPGFVGGTYNGNTFRVPM